MKLLNSHIINVWLQAFIGTYLVIIGFVLLEDVYKNFFLFLNSGVGFSSLLHYCIALICCSTTMIMPVVVFISTMFSLGRLHKQNEITAMRGIGMSLLQIARPLIICSLFIVIGSIILEMFIVPAANDKIYRLRAQYNAQHCSCIKKLGFFNHFDRRLWFIEEFDKVTYHAKNLMVYEYDDNACELVRIYAHRASFHDDKWELFDGFVNTFHPTDGRLNTVITFKEKIFDNLPEHPKVLLSAHKKLKYLSFREAVALLRYLSGTTNANQIMTKLNKIFSNSIHCSMILLLAIPLSVIGARASPMVAAAKTSGVLLLLYLLSGILTVFGTSGLVSSILAAWTPLIITMCLAVKFFQRAI